jgi:hypothetical protein
VKAFVEATDAESPQKGADAGAPAELVNAVAPLDMAAVESGYRDLMERYNRALAQASLVGRTRAGEPDLPSDKHGDAAGFLVRLMVKGHIRQRLHELSIGYLQLMPTATTDQAREWLDRAREDCERIVRALPRIQLRPLLLAVVAPLAAALSKLPGIPEWLAIVMISVAGGIPGFLIFCYATVRGSYRVKRELLLPGATKIDKLSAEQQRLHVAGNAFEAEDRAFAAIGRGKRREREADRLMPRLGLLLLAEALCFLPIALNSHQWVPLVVAGFVFAGYFLLLKFERERVWR